MERRALRGGAGAWAGLLVGVALLSGGCHWVPEEHVVTEWFKYKEVGPLFELPHVLRIGERSTRISLRVGDTWHESPGDAPFYRAAQQGQAVYGEGSWSGRIYLRGHKAPLMTGNVPCTALAGGWKEGSVACLSLRSKGRCDQLLFHEISLDGTQRTLAAEIPEAPFGCPWPDVMQWSERVSLVGYDAQGNPFVGAPSMNPGVPSLRNQWVLRLDALQAMPMEETAETELSVQNEELRQRYHLTPPRWPEPVDPGPAGK